MTIEIGQSYDPDFEIAQALDEIELGLFGISAEYEEELVQMAKQVVDNMGPMW